MRINDQNGSDRKTPRPLTVAVILLAVLGLLAYSLFNHLKQVSAPEQQHTDTAHFLYGSIGGDTTDAGSLGLPYWIWRAMPEVCPDLLPGGYASLGLIYQAGRDRPIGFSKRDVGLFDMVGLNCAVCHTASVRAAPDATAQFYPGAASHQLDLWGYFDFLFDCAQDARFNVDNVMATIDRIADNALSPFERFAYRQAIDPAKQTFIERAPLLSWVDQRPAWGPGRVDTFNPYKTLFGFKTDMTDDRSIGTADFMTIWDQRTKDGLHVHWDGNNASVDERNISAALGAGATPRSLDHHGLDRIRQWIATLKPQTYPFAIDDAKAQQGESVYAQHCYACHEPDGEYIGQVVSTDALGTDPERANAFDEEMAGYMNRIGHPEAMPWAFTEFRATDGYVNGVLDGVWLRAPYLHNGSVPTLRDLLSPVEQRPQVFYKGNDVYDPIDIGYVSDQARNAHREFFRFDTRLRGNSNAGHRYGTRLSATDKDALIEYLKTK